MYNYNYIIIDDLPEEIEKVKAKIKEFNQEDKAQNFFRNVYGQGILLNCQGSYNKFDGEILLNTEAIDLIFLDIKLGDIDDAGIRILTNVANPLMRKSVVLSEYIQHHRNLGGFRNILDWIQKPLELDNIKNVVDKLHIQKNDIRARFEETYVTILNRNQEIHYEDIDYIYTNGGEVIITMTNRKEYIFGANTLSLKKFDNRGNLRKINNHCAINISHKIEGVFNWQTQWDNGDCFVRHSQGQKRTQEKFKISPNFMQMIEVLAKRN